MNSKSSIFNFDESIIHRNQKTAFLLLSHGSKSPLAAQEFHTITESVAAQLTEYPIAYAFMELCKPSIQDQVSFFVKQNFSQILVIPYFLFTGNHILHDIPQILQELSNQYPKLNIRLGKPLGMQPAFIQAIAVQARSLILESD